MPKLVNTDDLKDTLEKFRVQGDGHWALKSELPTLEEIRQMVDESVEEIGGVVVEGLTPEDILEILEITYDQTEGPPSSQEQG